MNLISQRNTLLSLMLLWTFCELSYAQTSPQDLSRLNIEDLMNVKVTSVSRTEQKISKTASAVFVISPEDIQHSNATNIPDLLRMVPGIDVAQINANTWAISARGFNGRFSNKLLVLVDGRNVYDSNFGGVNWEMLDMPLEDIERIEVIRGPGATAWGDNAVNGVINIYTKSASDTPGGMVTAGAGNLNQGFGTSQYGGKLGRKTDYRVYAKYLNQIQLPSLFGGHGDDGWHVLRSGFRTDSKLSAKDSLTLQGNLYTGQEGGLSPSLASIAAPELVNVPATVPLSGGFIQSAWNHASSARSDFSLQTSFERYRRDDVLHKTRSILAVDFQHHFHWGGRQEIVWGAGYGYNGTETHGDLAVSFKPPTLTRQLFNAFFQDEVALLPEKLYVTAGTKLEHNYYTGLNWEPSARVTWRPTQRHMLWIAVSRAVNTPTDLNTVLRLNFAGFTGPGGLPTLVGLLGNPHLHDGRIVAWELGYRTMVNSHLSVDLATYNHNYGSQQTTEPAPPFLEISPAPTHLVLPLSYANLMHGEARGIEVAVNWQAAGRWRLSPGYAFEKIHMHLDPTSRDTTTVLQAERSSPSHSAQLRSSLNLTRNLAWDASAQFVDRVNGGGVPAYTRVDSGLTWNWNERFSASLVGQNLVKDRHLEFMDYTGSVAPTLVKRSAYAKVTWKF